MILTSRNKHFFYKKRQERIYWLNIIILLFITKTADNPSFPRCWRYGQMVFATNLTIKSFNY